MQLAYCPLSFTHVIVHLSESMLDWPLLKEETLRRLAVAFLCLRKLAEPNFLAAYFLLPIFINSKYSSKNLIVSLKNNSVLNIIRVPR